MAKPNQQSNVARKNLLEEAIAAARRGERAKARELITRVLRYDQKNEEAWLWMSSVVESDRERIFCLNSALKVNPDNKTAKRGLALLGALSPEMRADLGIEVVGVTFDGTSPEEKKKRKRGGFTIRRSRGLENMLIVLLAAVVVVVIVGIVWVQFGGLRALMPVAPTAAPSATQTLSPTDASLELTATRTPTVGATPTLAQLVAGTPGVQLTPLAEILNLKYTATPTSFAIQFFAENDYGLGETAFKAGEYDKALDLLKKAADQNPKNYSAHHYSGLIYLQKRDYNRAFTSFGNVVRINDQFAPGYIGRGQAQFGLGGNPLADYDKANTLDVKWGEPYLQKANYYMSVRGRNVNNAIAELEKGKRVAPNNVLLQAYLVEAYLLGNRVSDARATLEAAFKLDASVLDLYRARGRLALIDQEYKTAQTVMNTYTIYRADEAVGWMIYGQADVGAGDLNAALSKLNRAIELKPEDPREAYIALGEVNLNQNNITLAKENFTKALSLGASTSTRLRIGQAYYRKGDFENATKELKSALDSDATQFDTNYWLGAAYVGAKNYKDAVTYLTAALNVKTSYSDAQKFDALYQRGLAYNALNTERAKAVSDLTDALQLNVVNREKQRADITKLMTDQLFAPTPAATFTPTPVKP